MQRIAALATTPSRIVLVDSVSGPYTVVDGVHRIVAVYLYHKIRSRTTMAGKEAYLGIVEQPYLRKFG